MGPARDPGISQLSAGSGRERRPPARTRLALLVAAPLSLTLLVGLAGSLRVGATADPAERARQVQQAFRELLAQAGAIAASELGSDERSRGSVELRGRLEGVLVLDAAMAVQDWTGTPAEPPPDFAQLDASSWWIRRDGVHTRLLARAGPDARGRLALASFVADSKVDGRSVEELFPRSVRRGVQIEVVLTETRRTGPPGAGLPAPEAESDGESAAADSPVRVALSCPSGAVLGHATLWPGDSRRARERVWRAALAWGAVSFLLLLAWLVDWPGLTRQPRGLLVALGSLALGRALLLALHAPALILPRSVGEAAFFGSAFGGGLIGSPADLLLSGLAIFLACRAVVTFCLALPRSARGPAIALCLATGSGASLLGLALTLPLARDSRLPLLARRALIEGDPRPLVLLGLLLVLLGAALAWAAAARLSRNTGTDPAGAGGWPVALALALLAVVCSVALERNEERLALERLRDEFAPLTLEQRSRRTMALSATVRHVHDAYTHHEQISHLADASPEYLAYQFWAASELCSGGYVSSLDFYSANGERLSHFGFDLPLLRETIDPREVSRELELFDETYSVVASEQGLTHAEIAVERNGELLGVVVGHVLDEPSNLPFLPRSLPYLTALGAGPPRAGSRHGAELQYVLYDEFGTVRVSTLRPPPPETPGLRRAGREPGPIRVDSGGVSYIGYALADGGQLHLLLTPRPGWIARTAAAVRLALFALALLAAVTLLPQAFRPAGLRSLVHRLRRSFHRKLLTALLLASIVPLVGLGLILREYTERRGAADLVGAATQYVSVAQRVLEDYTAAQSEEGVPNVLDDNVLDWLRRVVGQEISVYDNGLLQASSKRELFDSGLLPLRIDGAAHRGLVREGRPSLVRLTRLGPSTIPVAYAPVRGADPRQELIVAVPVVLEQRQISGAIDRLVEVILLATVLLVGLLALTAAFLARTVARPVRELVEATAQIAAGDYETRLEPRTEDEVADLVAGFNSMASALSRQRADLEQRREYMERLLRHATTGVLSTDTSGRLVTLNPAVLALLAPVAPGLHIGADLNEVLDASDELRPLARVLRDSAPGEPEEVDLGPAGEPRRLRFVRIDLREPSGGRSGALILLDDVTELMRSNQLAAWAEMARAIAHEIKNPLTPIQLSSEHLRRLLEDRGVLPSTEIEACLETVIKQVRSLHQIAGEFSAYAKLPALAPEPVDPAQLAREVLAPYRSSCPPGLRIEERYESAGTISVDPKVLSRALVNLVENALQAMPDGGTLLLRVEPAAAGREVAIAVEDSGTGLDPEVRRRLFEPYFSTKSSGTGLGLAIVRRAVEAHHGRIEVRSELGRGTSIRIVLPRAAGA